MAAAEGGAVPSPVTIATSRLVGGLAAIGAAVLSSVQLATLGHLDDGAHLAIAAGAALVAIVAVIAAVLTFVAVMLPERQSLQDLCEREDTDAARGDDVHATYPAEVRATLRRSGFLHVRQLAAAYVEALELRRRALRLNQATPTPRTNKTAVDASEEASRLNAAIIAILDALQARRTEAAYGRAMRRLPALALMLVVALVGAVWATNPPDRDPLDLRGANLDGIQLHRLELRGAVLDGMRIEGADLRGTFLGDASIAGTRWLDTTCPDGTNSDEAGRTCAGHLEP